MPNCTNVSWTTDNIASKDIRLALIIVVTKVNNDDNSLARSYK